MLRTPKKMMYVLEAVVDIAYNAGTNPAQSRELTEHQGLPQRYLEQMMQRLVRAGVLKGVRGPRGGYHLARERRRITVGDVARTLNDADESDPLVDARCSDLADKVLRPLWRDVEADLMRQLDSITIDDLCNRAHARGVEIRDRERAHFDI